MNDVHLAKRMFLFALPGFICSILAIAGVWRIPNKRIDDCVPNIWLDKPFIRKNISLVSSGPYNFYWTWSLRKSEVVRDNDRSVRAVYCEEKE